MPRSLSFSCWTSVAVASMACTSDPSGVPPTACEGLASLGSSSGSLVITSAQSMPAGSDGALTYPAHCAVSGAIDARQGADGKPYAIGFELRLPLEDYSDRLFFQGGGGTDGVIVPAYGNLLNTAETNALTLGYAVVSTDGGHTGQMDVSFGLDPQARIDYGYNAVGQVVRVAKELLAAYYGSTPQRSYFVGCSNGGRQALVAASRFAEEFDGFLAVNPGLNLPKAAVAQAWDTQQLMSAAQQGQLPKDAFPPEVLATVAAHILDRCDALDGLADGIVHDSAACQGEFDIAADVPTCSGADTADCLSAAQKSALAGVFGGVEDAAGQSLYAPFPWDPGMAGTNWRFWKLDAGFAPLPFNTIIGASSLGYVFTTPPDLPDLADGGLGYQLGLNVEAAAAKLTATAGDFGESALEFMTPPNPTQLTALADGSGKLIVVHGTGDPVFSSDDTAAWYRALLAADAGAADYAQLFLVPQMNHCAGGPATDRFDMFTVLENWVEDGVAPAAVVARVDPTNPDVAALEWPSTRTRLLCPYPARAVLTPGASDTESSAAFTCQ